MVHDARKLMISVDLVVYMLSLTSGIQLSLQFFDMLSSHGASRLEMMLHRKKAPRTPTNTLLHMEARSGRPDIETLNP